VPRGAPGQRAGAQGTAKRELRLVVEQFAEKRGLVSGLCGFCRVGLCSPSCVVSLCSCSSHAHLVHECLLNSLFALHDLHLLGVQGGGPLCQFSAGRPTSRVCRAWIGWKTGAVHYAKKLTFGCSLLLGGKLTPPRTDPIVLSAACVRVTSRIRRQPKNAYTRTHFDVNVLTPQRGVFVSFIHAERSDHQL